MADFNVKVINTHRVYMVDFGRARTGSPRGSRPEVDRFGYMDAGAATEHGPVVSCLANAPRCTVRLYRTEISNSARLLAVPSDGAATIRMVTPANGVLPGTRNTDITFRPVAAGRTSLDIRYYWADGPIIGRLYVDVRAMRTIQCRVHLLSINGAGFGNSFLGEARPGGMAAATHRTNRIATIFADANHVLEPHGIRLVNAGTVNTAWTNANFPAAIGQPFARIMRAMAGSPNRSAAHVNLYLGDWPQAQASAATNPGFGLGFVALGPPVNWAVQRGSRWPNTPAGNVGSGIMVDTSSVPFTGAILAHEVGHVLRLSSLTAAGAVNQWHAIGDNTASRDDILTRRRLMYPYTSLQASDNSWRANVGYGNNMGAMLVQRQHPDDSTLDESRRAYANCTAAMLYAP